MNSALSHLNRVDICKYSSPFGLFNNFKSKFSVVVRKWTSSSEVDTLCQAMTTCFLMFTTSCNPAVIFKVQFIRSQLFPSWTHSSPLVRPTNDIINQMLVMAATKLIAPEKLSLSIRYLNKLTLRRRRIM